MKVNGQLHTPITLPSRKEPPTPYPLDRKQGAVSKNLTVIQNNTLQIKLTHVYKEDKLYSNLLLVAKSRNPLIFKTHT